MNRWDEENRNRLTLEHLIDCTATHKCKLQYQQRRRARPRSCGWRGAVHREGWDFFGSAARRREIAGSGRRTAVLAANPTAERGATGVSAGGEARGTEWKCGGLCFLGRGQEGEAEGEMRGGWDVINEEARGARVASWLFLRFVRSAMVLGTCVLHLLEQQLHKKKIISPLLVCVLLFRIPLLWLFRSQIIGMISSATAAALDVARDRIAMPAAAFSSYLYNRTYVLFEPVCPFFLKKMSLYDMVLLYLFLKKNACNFSM